MRGRKGGTGESENEEEEKEGKQDTSAKNL